MRHRWIINHGILLIAAVALFHSADFASAITIETVPVGDVGNPNDPSDGDTLVTGVQNFGAVSYAYRIGKYEVTVGQYTDFLNAVAATDTYGLYNTNMATRVAIAGISRDCPSGSCTYSVIGSPNRPIAYVSWGSAARFANWIQNGQPTGAQNNTTTETGAYTLNGAATATALNAVTRNANAKWFIPTENEWYKAAYYQPAAQGGDSDSYWTYPMRTNNQPYSIAPPGTAAPDKTKTGNFFFNDGLANGYNDGHAVTGSTSSCFTQNCLTDVGAYTFSPGYYGTFDLGGNLYELNEAIYSANSRIIRGGAWEEGKLESYWRLGIGTASGAADTGFRLASISVPGDFNGDLVVNAADYVTWRKANGPASDYDLWRANFGQGFFGSGAYVSDAVPEPSSLILFMVTAAILCATLGRPRSCIASAR